MAGTGGCPCDKMLEMGSVCLCENRNIANTGTNNMLCIDISIGTRNIMNLGIHIRICIICMHINMLMCVIGCWILITHNINMI